MAHCEARITLDEDRRLVVSRELRGHCSHKLLKTCFLAFEGKPIEQPSRFRPDSTLIRIHREQVFQG